MRADWARLAGAGLTSQSRHPSPTNRPHVTLAAVAALPEGAEERLAAACSGLPLRARLGPLAVLGHDPVVLVRLVVVTADLLALHAQVAGAAGVPGDDLAAPGRWLPHLTLARRMPLTEVSRAIDLLPREDEQVRFVAARRWDSEARRTWPLGQPPPGAATPGRGDTDARDHHQGDADQLPLRRQLAQHHEPRQGGGGRVEAGEHPEHRGREASQRQQVEAVGQRRGQHPDRQSERQRGRLEQRGARGRDPERQHQHRPEQGGQRQPGEPVVAGAHPPAQQDVRRPRQRRSQRGERPHQVVGAQRAADQQHTRPRRAPPTPAAPSRSR